ncbi:hypothetical protein CPT03_02265 [Pedobacter ginsengisoli]|uniref:Lantibiotic dehydratase n=1 Tax=Pedobacter ginsengisoli TaxID=363852 RepID=A0A2D1U196_9SPHI|nr:lantibiotic dehydratase [Pedobacter ginsengisoli]ATP55370.1 hypothetical protein CPT03_02265 [Pedobacter ginsengisoli]
MENIKWDSNFFVLRTPMLPLSNFYSLFKKLRNESETDAIWQYLNDDLLEAIYLASPTLYDEIKKHKENPLNLNSVEINRLTKSIFKYISRASTRCTPFGLFANCMVGLVSDSDNFIIPANKIIKNLRLDMDSLCSLSNHLKNIPEIRKNLEYFPNSAIYKINGKLKYIEYKYNVKGDRTFHLSKITSDAILKDILRISNNGKSYFKIVNELCGLYDFTRDEIKGYVDSLIDNNVLYSCIEPNVTGDEFFNIIHRKLADISKYEPSVIPIFQALESISHLISSIENGDNNVDTYKRIVELFKTLCKDGAVNESKLFQMDTSKVSSTLSIERKSIDHLFNSIKKIHSINNTINENHTLKKFKKAFLERYDNQSVKLVELFDNETGMGYRNAKSLSDFYSTQESRISNLEKLALKKFLEFLKSGNKEIIIQEEDLKPYKSHTRGLPSSFSVMANITHNDLNEKYFSINGFSLSTTSLLGRFCHSDDKLYDNVLDLIEKEKETGCITAEIAHLPQARIGNILSRPIITDYEIEFLSLSGVPSEKKITIDDLYVKLVGNEIVLFSKKLKKRIIPKLSSAHNYSSGSLDIYHFLCDVQYQNLDSVQFWNWGVSLADQAFLPRVTFNNCILSPAQWSIDCLELQKAVKLNKTTFLEELRVIQKKIDLPMIVVLKQYDNFLTLDLSTGICIDILEKEVGKNKSVRLFEFITSNNEVKQSFNDGDLNIYSNEVIIPFSVSNKKRVLQPFITDWIKPIKNKRKFFLGDDWFYIKIYAKQKNLNKVLIKLSSVLKRNKVNKNITSWFFIRYGDPFPHLRFRFLVSKDIDELIKDLFGQLQPMIKDNFITNIVTDTYEREIERYGDNSIVMSEDLFHINSELVVFLVEKKAVLNSGLNLQNVALMIIDRTLDIFDYSLSEKSEFYNRSFKRFSVEFNYNLDKGLKAALQNQYRSVRGNLNFLNKKLSQVENLNLDLYFRKLTSIVHDVKIDDTKSIDSFLESHVHMFVNRLFSVNQRFEEFIIYYLLDSYYRSVIAQNKIKL